MGALALFMVGSILSSVAWNIGALIAFRVVQGIGGGLMLPILQNLLVEAAGGRKLGRIMALISLPTLFGPIVGPVVGGLIVNNLSWRWIFWIDVPFSAAPASAPSPSRSWPPPTSDSPPTRYPTPAPSSGSHNNSAARSAPPSWP
jgi:MFS family permease